VNGGSVFDAKFRALPSSIAGLYKGSDAFGAGNTPKGRPSQRRAVSDEARSVWDSAKERDL
jgi:hypothetical protein